MKDLVTIHKNCKEIFVKGFFQTDESGEVNICGPSMACRIYDALTEGDGSKQDCIGENFNQLIHRLKDNWFDSYRPSGDLDYYFFTYTLWLYLFVERVWIIFEVINPNDKSKLFSDFMQTNFKTLRKINKWANFIKHPKEFLFTHWPHYYLEGSQQIILEEDDIIIDTDFIFKHYFSEKNERPVKLLNNSKVYVEIPDMEKITDDFCREMNIFFDFICSNRIVADFLKKRSTIENHYFDSTLEAMVTLTSIDTGSSSSTEQITV